MRFDKQHELETLRETETASENLFDGIILHVRRDTVALPNGKPANREVIRHIGAVCVIPVLEKTIRLRRMLKSLVLVYIGNLIGSVLLAAAVVYSHQAALFDNGVAVSVIETAAAKCSITFGDALLRGILCNFLVCIAVWISFAAKDITGKIIGVFFPILIFVLCGFEHSVANMYYISAGLFAKTVPAFAQAAAGIDTSMLTVGNMLLRNLLPVTIGNIIGGAGCVGLPYWYIYLRRKNKMDILSDD